MIILTVFPWGALGNPEIKKANAIASRRIFCQGVLPASTYGMEVHGADVAVGGGSVDEDLEGKNEEEEASQSSGGRQAGAPQGYQHVYMYTYMCIYECTTNTNTC